MLNVKLVITNSLYLVDSLQVPEPTNATKPLKLAIPSLGSALDRMQMYAHQYVLLTQLLTMVESVTFTEAKTMIIINSMTFGSSILPLANIKSLNSVLLPICLLMVDLATVQIYTTAECTSLEVFLNWLRRSTR